MVDSTVDEGTASQIAESKPLSQRAIETVADAEGLSQTELEPLYSAIDCDALDALFRPQRKPGAIPNATAEVRFTYHGYEVRATATGRVTLTEQE